MDNAANYRQRERALAHQRALDLGQALAAEALHLRRHEARAFAEDFAALRLKRLAIRLRKRRCCWLHACRSLQACSQFLVSFGYLEGIAILTISASSVKIQTQTRGTGLIKYEQVAGIDQSVQEMWGTATVS